MFSYTARASNGMMRCGRKTWHCCASEIGCFQLRCIVHLQHTIVSRFVMWVSESHTTGKPVKCSTLRRNLGQRKSGRNTASRNTSHPTTNMHKQRSRTVPRCPQLAIGSCPDAHQYSHMTIRCRTAITHTHRDSQTHTAYATEKCDAVVNPYGIWHNQPRRPEVTRSTKGTTAGCSQHRKARLAVDEIRQNRSTERSNAIWSSSCVGNLFTKLAETRPSGTRVNAYTC